MSPPSLTTDLAYRVDAFEAAIASDFQADLAEFLPEPHHPHYDAVLVELVRVDLERAWNRAAPRRIEHYLARFPRLAASSDLLSPLAFEEYRQRLLHGEAASTQDYETKYSIDTREWDPLSQSGAGEATARVSLVNTPMNVLMPEALRRRAGDLPATDPADQALLRALGEGADTWPEPGAEFMGFQIVRELGRGAFARVYLARQGELGSRYVAVKIARDIAVESVTLAQLQHTNIVPIYSFHRDRGFQAVCMPYFGQTTLAQVLANLNGGRTLPARGRDLRSTVQAHSFSANPVSWSNPSKPSSDSQPGDAGAPAIPMPPDAMPYTGLSLEGWTRLEGLSYVEAILTLAQQLADGLAHAHARGILHRDLKPANILFTDEGRPMLLDFNLAEDMKTRDTALRAAVGGTLPYMAPEHLQAFGKAGKQLDVGCDIYSFGVILFELLTGRHPFPVHKGPIDERVRALLADRLQPPPSPREFNRDISPAVEAIVCQCLMPDLEDRYRSAGHLREDLERHLKNEPLRHAPNPSLREVARKWLKRHPRIASSGSVAALAAAVILAIGVSAWYLRDRARTLEARTTFDDHRAAFAAAQLFLDDRHQSRADLDGAHERLRGVLNRYDIVENTSGWQAASNVDRLPPADRDRVRSDIGETFYLMAQVAYLKALSADAGASRDGLVRDGQRWNGEAGTYAGDQLKRAIAEQQAEFADLAGDADAAKASRMLAASVELDTARDLFLYGMLLSQKGHHRDAIAHLQRSTVLDPHNFSAWFVRGSSHLEAEQPEQAAMCFGACLALRDDFLPAWLNRGLAFSRAGLHDQAIADYQHVLKLDPGNLAAYLHRAESREALGDFKGAEADYAAALATGVAPVRILFRRAEFRKDRGDLAGADADRKAAMALTPTDSESWRARAEARNKGEEQLALADVEEALKLNPLSAPALQLKANLLGEELGRSQEALATLNRGVELHPENVRLRAGRGVLLARQGRRDDAVRDAEIAHRLDPRAQNVYQVACIYALGAEKYPKDKTEALNLLWLALKTGFGQDVYPTDHDLDPLRTDAEFIKLIADVEAINRIRNR